MRKDVTREREGAKDSGGPLCKCGLVAWADTRGSPHRRGTEGCKHEFDHKTGPRSKHSPIPVDEFVPF